MRLVDTHCHLDLEAFDEDRAQVLARARASGVERILVVGFAPERWGPALRLAQSEPDVAVAVGLHPTEAARYNDEVEAGIREAAMSPSVCAIGEIGLDYHWMTAPAEVQRRAFLRQIALAREMDLPFIVHQRDAAEDTLDALQEAGPPHRGVMHCFTGDLTYAERCLAMGMYLGIGGAVTFRKATDLHEVVRSVPLDRLVLETDAPYMTPSPHRGKRNEPSYLRFIVERVAELRDTSVEEVAEATTANAARLFNLDIDGRAA